MNLYSALLLGWLNKVRQDTEKDDLYMGNARYYLTKAKEVHVKNPTQDKEMVMVDHKLCIRDAK